MLTRKPARLAALTVASLFGFMPCPAQAQVLSKWGNPVISFGQTPYYANDSGHGNIPGGNGFTPGYGYYPGNNIPGTTYPWLTGPDVPDYHRYPHGLPHAAVAPAPSPEADPAAALLTVRVPDNADIWISGVRTKQRGELRTFVTPPLDGKQIFTYEIHARWTNADGHADRTKEVQVRSGDRLTVDLLRDDGNSLPPPRKLDVP